MTVPGTVHMKTMRFLSEWTALILTVKVRGVLGWRRYCAMGYTLPGSPSAPSAPSAPAAPGSPLGPMRQQQQQQRRRQRRRQNKDTFVSTAGPVYNCHIVHCTQADKLMLAVAVGVEACAAVDSHHRLNGGCKLLEYA
jgi:hypothetical protein